MRAHVIVTCILVLTLLFSGVLVWGMHVFATPMMSPSSMGPVGMTEVNKIRLQTSDWVFDASAKKKTVDVALTNVSDGMVWTPVKVIIDSIDHSGVAVTNPDGMTDEGLPYFRYLAPSTLASGESTAGKTWEFSYGNASSHFGHPLSFTTRVFVCTDADFDGYFLETGCGTAPDCNDSDPAIHPGATEICDEIDNNCSGQIDEGVQTTYYPDYDGDGHGNIASPSLACAAAHHQVTTDDDCDDGNPNWWQGDPGSCIFAGYTACTAPYEQGCNPPVFDVIGKLQALAVDVNKDKFGWTGFVAPGGLSSGQEKRHLQSIQYFSRPAPAGEEYAEEPFLVVTMSDETANDWASISLVDIGAIGSEGDPLDAVVFQSMLNLNAATAGYNHAGGAQLIGDYLFVALEDFEGAVHSDPKVGIWRIRRQESPSVPDIIYWDSFDAFEGDPHHTAVAVTKLADESYLVAACVIGGCDTIRFFKSEPGISLIGHRPDFIPIYQWGKSELISSVEDSWADCDPQNMNMVVDTNGDIYLVMFGVERTGLTADLPCGSAEHDDQIFIYRLSMAASYDIEVTFVTKVDVGTGGDHCDCARLDIQWPPIDICGYCDPLVCNIPIGATDNNFDAGSGLWIKPLGENDIAILATEHYDSCGDPGKSRWGVTGNWDD